MSDQRSVSVVRSQSLGRSMSGRLSVVGEDDDQFTHADAKLDKLINPDSNSDDIDDLDDLKDLKSAQRMGVKNTYIAACKLFNQVPMSYFLKWQGSDTLRMGHHSIGPVRLKAICVSLVSNTTVELLDMDDNGLECQGCVYIADMLRENYFITDLTLSNNSIGAKGAIALFEVVKQSDSLVKLNISGNKIGDGAAHIIGDALSENTKLTDLNLSCNSLGEVTGIELSQMLQMDPVLQRLDLSFNNLRTKGAQMFFHGLKKNQSILYLNFANNGIGLEGCAELGIAIKDNKTLEELDITNNRLPAAATVLLAKGLKDNHTLKYLDLSRNPLTAAGCMVLLEMLCKVTTNALRFLSFGNILVTRQFEEMQRTLECEKYLLIKHGGIVEEWKHKPHPLPACIRETLCFLTEEERGHLVAALDRTVTDADKNSDSYKNSNIHKKRTTTVNTFTKVVNECGWVARSTEMARRVVAVVKHGQIDYTSLLDDS